MTYINIMSLALAVTSSTRGTTDGGDRWKGTAAEERGACCLGGEGQAQAAFAWPCVYDLASNAIEQLPRTT